MPYIKVSPTPAMCEHCGKIAEIMFYLEERVLWQACPHCGRIAKFERAEAVKAPIDNQE